MLKIPGILSEILHEYIKDQTYFAVTYKYKEENSLQNSISCVTDDVVAH